MMDMSRTAFVVFVTSMSLLASMVGSRLTIYLIDEHPLDDRDFLVEAARRFGNNHEYVLSEYDCDNMSYDFGKLMQEFGYPSTVKIGYNEDYTTGHAWNTFCMDYDITNGGFIGETTSEVYSRDLIEEEEW